MLLPLGQSQVWTGLTDMNMPAVEKVVRTIAVYLLIALVIRVAGGDGTSLLGGRRGGRAGGV